MASLSERRQLKLLHKVRIEQRHTVWNFLYHWLLRHGFRHIAKLLFRKKRIMRKFYVNGELVRLETKQIEDIEKVAQDMGVIPKPRLRADDIKDPDPVPTTLP